jgi:NitT/TauT family transport system permease protein
MVSLVKLRKSVFNLDNLEKAVSIVLFFILWQLLGSLNMPLIRNIPVPTEVATAFAQQLGVGAVPPPAAGPQSYPIYDYLVRKLGFPMYYVSMAASLFRVFAGFFFAILVGVPMGLMMGWNKTFNEITFPVFEILRPIPPIAWIPMSIILFPTVEQSITFITFIGAFFCITVNTILGVQSIDINLKRCAASLGASPRQIFRYVIVPGSVPAIVTGAAIGIGITWEVVVAAEMIAGGVGLGYLTWSAYIGGVFPVIIVGMISIGIAGYFSSGLLRFVGNRLTPWKRLF